MREAQVAIGAKAITVSQRDTIADAALVWENIYVDMTYFPNGPNTAPNVGDMFSARQCRAAHGIDTPGSRQPERAMSAVGG
jgi:hypothetical protein